MRLRPRVSLRPALFIPASVTAPVKHNLPLPLALGCPLEWRVGLRLAERSGSRGVAFETHTGVFYPCNPTSSEVRLEDISFALAHINRFGGHVGTYSVAEHSCRVAQLLSGTELKLAGLLHDAAEAYLIDLPRPLKQALRDHGVHLYDELEARVQEAIEIKFDLPRGICSSAEVKIADDTMLATERRDLFPGREPWVLPPPHPDRIIPWTAEQAILEFRRLAAELLSEKGKGTW